MTFGQFLSFLRARWWVALVVFLITVFATLAINLSLPKQYRASSSVIVDFKPDPVSAVLYGGAPSPGFMATQVDIIQSDRVAQRVVRNLKLAESPQIRQQWQDETRGQGTIENWLGSVFQRSMDVAPSRESNVIQISYKAPDPRFSAALANAFVQAYIDTVLELRVDPARQYSSFFETRATEARVALETAQGKLSQFQNVNGIVATDERFDIENGRLNELSSQLTVLQALNAESSSRQAQSRSAQGENIQEVLNNGLVSGLKSDISRTNAKIKELLTRYGENHPQVMEAKANLAELQQRRDAEIKKVTSSIGIQSNINAQRLADVRAALDAQRSKILKLKAVRDEGLVLLRDVENAQRGYDAIQQRVTQTTLESQATQSNVNLLTQAVPPLQPASPRVVLNTLVGALVGLVLAVGLSLFLEMRDRRIRNVDDVITTLELPVLVTLPKPGSRLKFGNSDSLMQRRLMAPLSATSKAS